MRGLSPLDVVRHAGLSGQSCVAGAPLVTERLRRLSGRCGRVAEEWWSGTRRIFVYRTHVPHLWASWFPDKFAQEAVIYFTHGEARLRRTVDAAARYVDGQLRLGSRPISELAGARPGVMSLTDDVAFVMEGAYRAYRQRAVPEASVMEFSRSCQWHLKFPQNWQFTVLRL